MGCAVLGCGAEPPQIGVLFIWLEPGISHVTWVHYDATICLPYFGLLDIARFALFAIWPLCALTSYIGVRTGLEH